ncbi:MAG: DUF6036 family nucleotidyltransferase [Verrucomicrobiota bacterium]
MNNPLRILRTLDRHLAAPAEITLFGRAALALGYAAGPAAFAATHDVDAILPLSWLAAEDENLDFWEAQQHTNAELEPEGLYVTHLFRELEVILTPDWLSRRVRIPLELRRLAVFRPATLDLILTKMARGDENDLADIEFLLTRELLTSDQLRAAFARARVPDIPETQALFLAAQSKVLALAKPEGYTPATS